MPELLEDYDRRIYELRVAMSFNTHKVRLLTYQLAGTLDGIRWRFGKPKKGMLQ